MTSQLLGEGLRAEGAILGHVGTLDPWEVAANKERLPWVAGRYVDPKLDVVEPAVLELRGQGVLRGCGALLPCHIVETLCAPLREDVVVNELKLDAHLGAGIRPHQLAKLPCQAPRHHWVGIGVLKLAFLSIIVGRGVRHRADFRC